MAQSRHSRWGLSTSGANLQIVGVIVVVAVVANIAGYVFDLYSQVGWFDKVLHSYTIFAMTLVCGLWLYGKALTGSVDHRLLLVIVVTCIGVAIGSLWEVAEWSLDQVVAGNLIKGKFDTITDVIVDTLGSIVAAVLVLVMVDHGKSTS